MFQNKYKIINKKELAENIFKFVLQCPELAKVSKSGQFIMLAVEGKTLRRPISICEIGLETLTIIFEIRGDGTAKLAEKNIGDFFDIVAPCGNGFPDLTPDFVVGGGIGVPPLLTTAKPDKTISILGFRNKSKIILETDFKNTSKDLIIYTDDGSYGEKGVVTDELLKRLEKNQVVFSCGPMPMLKAVDGVCQEIGAVCYVSLEERMGCGLGACAGCSIKTKQGMKRACKQGPVFNYNDLIAD